jgi:hypothetical protein
MNMNHQSLIQYAKISHSDNLVLWGADSLEAEAAMGIVKAMVNAPSRPVKEIVVEALNGFVETLVGQKDGMRVGGDNPRDRLDKVFATFLEENDVTSFVQSAEVFVAGYVPEADEPDMPF